MREKIAEDIGANGRNISMRKPENKSEKKILCMPLALAPNFPTKNKTNEKFKYSAISTDVRL